VKSAKDIKMTKVSLTFPSFLITSYIAAAVAVAVVTEAFVLPPTSNTKVYNDGASMAKESGDSKKEYRFGDLTRGLLKRVKEDSSSTSYKFGDISRWLDKKAKERVSKFTSKENYKFGDMSKEVIRRLRDGEYSRDDLWLFLKIVATIGINLQPVTSVLPLKVLMDLLNMTMEASIAKTVGDKAVSAIANEIDGRMKELITGDRNYKLGDFTERAVSKWTGKENYEAGDITKTVLDKRTAAQDRETSNGQKSSSEEDEIFELFSSKSSEKELLEEWDEKLMKARREKDGLGELKDDESYQDWDKKFLSSSSSSTS